MPQEPFSKRHNYRGPVPEITAREDAPETLRATALDTARELGWGPGALRDVLTGTLRVRPDRNNWSTGNILEEVERLTYGSPWFKVYDIIEALYAAILEDDDRHYNTDNNRKSAKFASEINECLVDEGIGWQLVDGQIVTRGTEAFEAAVADANAALAESRRPTAARHIHEALQALSRRPEADVSGAIYHAMGALEAVARDLAGDEKATLGEILKHHPELVPPPLDKALSQVWGYASNVARHVFVGRDPKRDDAELVVGLAATVAAYLAKRATP